MEITHGAETSAKTRLEVEAEIGGAVLHEPTEDGPAYYEIFSLDDIDTVLESGKDYVTGVDEDMIEQRLHKQHPTHDDCVLIYRDSEYWPPSQMKKVQHSRCKAKDCWLLLKNPLAATEDYAELMYLTQQHGPVLVEDRGYAAYAAERFRKHGFAVQLRHPGLLLINYNPNRYLKTQFKRATNTYKELMRGYFEGWQLDLLCRMMSPKHWPADNRFSIYLDSEFTNGHRGARERGHFFSTCNYAEHVLNLRELARKFTAKTWWREGRASVHTDGEYYGEDFKGLLGHMLPYIHGVEDEANRILAIDDPNVDEESYRQPARDVLKFCRWLRREARAVGVPIPAKPQPPKRATRKKAKKKAKKKRD